MARMPRDVSPRGADEGHGEMAPRADRHPLRELVREYCSFRRVTFFRGVCLYIQVTHQPLHITQA